jgi:hypothetical protein
MLMHGGRNMALRGFANAHQRVVSEACQRGFATSACPQAWLDQQRPVAENLLMTTCKGLTLQEAYDVCFYGNVATIDPLGRVRTCKLVFITCV